MMNLPKRIVLFCFGSLLFHTSLLAQSSPELINYQAVARDGDGNELAGVSLDVEFSIIEGGPFSNPIYEELHSGVITDAFGLFTLQVGSGVIMQGDFSSINWSESTYLKIGIDAGNGMIDLGTMQLVSVPYALYATKADSANYAADEDADPENEFQELQLNGSELSLSEDASSTLVNLAGFNTDSQQLSIVDSNNENVTVGLENSNDISIPIEDADADSLNEIQALELNGNELSLSNDASGTVVDLGGFNTDNQQLSLVSSDNQNVSIGLENAIDITFPIEDEDADPLNEIQSLSKNGSTVSLSQGGGEFIDEVDDADASSTNELISTVDFNTSSNVLTITESGTDQTADLSGLKEDLNWDQNGQNIHNNNSGNVGINEANPSSSLHVSGSMAAKVRVEGPSGSNYTLGEETIFIGKPDIGDVEVELPLAASVPGRIYIIKKADPSTFNDLKIHTTGSDNIEGLGTYILGDVSGVYEQVIIVSDGVSDWWVISKD